MGLREARIDHAHRPDESVSFANHGFQKARLVGVIAQGRTDFAHDVVDVWLGIDEKIGTPEFCNNILARNQLFSTSDKKDQQLHGLLFEFDPAPAAPKFIAAE